MKESIVRFLALILTFLLANLLGFFFATQTLINRELDSDSFRKQAVLNNITQAPKTLTGHQQMTISSYNISQRINEISQGPDSSPNKDMAFSSKMPAAMYKYQTPEFVYKRAEHRFAQLDQFIEPNELLCQTNGNDSRPVALLMWIHTAPNHFKLRQIIRRTWGERSVYRDLGLRIVPVFAIGIIPNDLKMEYLVKQESETFKDIVRLNYIDSYHNITYKIVGGMRWVAKYCRQAKVMLKVDDDTLVVPHKLSQWMKKEKAWADMMTVRALYISHYRLGGRDMAKNSKWYISEKEWPLKHLGKQSAPGLGYFISTDLLPYYFHAMHYVPWIWLEDVWITGILPEALVATGVQIHRLPTTEITVMTYSYIKNTLTKQWQTHNSTLVGQMPADIHVYEKVLAAAGNGR